MSKSLTVSVEKRRINSVKEKYMSNDTQRDPTKVYRAALVPYIIENDEIKMMFMKPAADVAEWSGDCFQLAKGKIENGETAVDAAIREAHEELGLFRGNVILTEEVGVFMGRTTVFVSKVKDKDMFGLPSDETSDTTWMTESEFIELGRDLHKPVVQAAMRQIRRIEDM
jgi:8-oxo-dGTP pyrophosphatase MutT (NUDIX family)